MTGETLALNAIIHPTEQHRASIHLERRRRIYRIHLYIKASNVSHASDISKVVAVSSDVEMGCGSRKSVNREPLFAFPYTLRAVET